MKIVVDLMGGDKPEEIVKGAAAVAKNFPDIGVTVTGDLSLINSVIDKENIRKNTLDIVPTSEVITNEESPTMAIKTKKDSSMVKAFNILKESDDYIGMISTGSTGAVLTGGTLIIGRIPTVYRPTLVSLLPTIKGGMVSIADSGANVDSRPEWLYQFAIMANAYMRAMTGKENPTVALLNVGTEEHKGNELTHATFPLLKNSSLNFVGNMEARDTLSGNYDVVVCDGYDGNVLLKGSEGAAKMIMKLLKETIMSSFSAKIGYLFMKKSFKKLRSRLDFNNYGGAPFLGIKKCVLKTHGASSPQAIVTSAAQAIKMHKEKVIENIIKEITETTTK